MSRTTKRVVYWAPRVLCIAFAAFLSIFALDVFDMHADFGRTALALVMHLIPTGIVLAALVIAWRREWIAAILFPLLAVIHVVTKWGLLDWSGYAVIDGPLLVLGALFVLNWRYRAELRSRSGAHP